jgi:hypothetical protein
MEEMQMKRYRLSNGLFVYPEKDMEMLQKMSLKGYHVESINALGFYRFVQGPPKEYTYSFNSETDLSDDFLEFYKESGWTPIIVQERLQIFRAPSGTIPIFTESESKAEVINKHRKTYSKATLITFSILAAFTALSKIFDFGMWAYFVWTILWIPFAFSFIPYLGLSRSYRACKKLPN